MLKNMREIVREAVCEKADIMHVTYDRLLVFAKTIL